MNTKFKLIIGDGIHELPGYCVLDFTPQIKAYITVFEFLNEQQIQFVYEHGLFRDIVVPHQISSISYHKIFEYGSVQIIIIHL